MANTPARLPQLADVVLFFLSGGRSHGRPRPAIVVEVPLLSEQDGRASLRAQLVPTTDRGALCYGDPSDPNTGGYVESAPYSTGREPGTWCYVADLTDPPHGGAPTRRSPRPELPAPTTVPVHPSKEERPAGPSADASTDPPHGG